MVFDNITIQFFGITITLLVYIIFHKLFIKFKIALLNPLLFSTFFLIFFLKITNIEYEIYNSGASILTSLITPATIALAVPLYRNFDLFKKHYISIISGVIVGNTLNCFIIGYTCKFLAYETDIIASFMPKSVTTAIAIDLSKNIGGIVPISILLVIITGITGAVTAPIIFKLLKIKDPVAMGLSLGSSSHAVGTSKAMELGEKIGAISGLSIGITGIYVVLVAPLILKVILL